MSTVLEVVLLNIEDYLTIGKCAQLCQGLRRAVCERYPDLYDTKRAADSRQSGRCVICGEKSRFNKAFNCVIHPQKCLPSYVMNEAYLPSDPWIPDWSRLAPCGEFHSRRGRPRPTKKLAFWDKDDGIIARTRTTSFILKARSADFQDREAKFIDREAASKAAKKAQQAEKRRKPAAWKALPVAERRQRALDERIRYAAAVICEYLATLRRDGDCDLQPPSPTLESVLNTLNALATRAGYPLSDLELALGDHFGSNLIYPKTTAANLDDLLRELSSILRQPRLDRERRARKKEEHRRREERQRQVQLKLEEYQRQSQLRLEEQQRKAQLRVDALKAGQLDPQEEQCLLQRELRRVQEEERVAQEEEKCVQREIYRQGRMKPEARRLRQERLARFARGDSCQGEPQLPCPCGHSPVAVRCPYVLCGKCCTSLMCPRHKRINRIPPLPGPHLTNAPPAQP